METDFFEIWRSRQIHAFSKQSLASKYSKHTSEWNESVVIDPQVIKVLTLLNLLFC